MTRTRIAAATLVLTSVFCFSSWAGTRPDNRAAATLEEISQSQELRAGAQWQAIADNMATQISLSLKNDTRPRIVHLNFSGDGASTKDRFSELLTLSLVKQGWDFSILQEGALTVEVRYSIQPYQPGRAKAVYFSGDTSRIGAGLWAVAGISDSGAIPQGRSLELAAGREGFSWLNTEGDSQAPQAEILMTARIQDGNQLLARHTSLYFADDGELGRFWQQGEKRAELPLQGD